MADDEHDFDAESLMQMMKDSERSRTQAEIQEKEGSKNASLPIATKRSSKKLHAPARSLDAESPLKWKAEGEEALAEEEVKMANMESRLRGVIIEMLKPTIVKSTKLHTDHEIMCAKFQSMIEGHNNVLAAQKEAKEHSEMVHMFKNKLDDFWEHSNDLEDKISQYQKATMVKIEETEHALELNKSNTARLGRNLDKALQDMDRIHGEIKAMQLSLEKGIQKNKERMEADIRTLQLAIQDIRELNQKLEVQVMGHEDCDEIAPPSLRRLDMQMKRRTRVLEEAVSDIAKLQRIDTALQKIGKRQSEADVELKELQTTTKKLSCRVEESAEEAKDDFKKASNLMAAFSANLVREARHNFKDELKHAQEMQQGVDQFVEQTKFTMHEMDINLKSVCRQVEASVREVRLDIESLERKRKSDKQGVEDQVRQLSGRVCTTADLSESLLRGLEHVSGVISMSLQSHRMSVALDLQDYLERKDTPYVGLRDNMHEHRRAVRSADGIRRPAIDVECLHRIMYQPKPVSYQGTSFERSQLITLREKLVHGAQETLRHGPEHKPSSTSPVLGHSPVAARGIFSPSMGGDSGTPRCGSSSGMRPDSHQQRPGSRNQPSARGSPLLEGLMEGDVDKARDGQFSPDGKRASPHQTEVNSHLSGAGGLKDARPSVQIAAAANAAQNAVSAVVSAATTTAAPNGNGDTYATDAGLQLPSLSGADGRSGRSRTSESKTLDLAVMPTALGSR